MAVQDDLRRLTQVDSIYLGCTFHNMGVLSPAGSRVGCNKPTTAVGYFAQLAPMVQCPDFNSGR